MSYDNGTIVVRLLEIYRALIAQNEQEEGVPVGAYKNIDVDALPEILDRTSWERLESIDGVAVDDPRGSRRLLVVEKVLKHRRQH